MKMQRKVHQHVISKTEHKVLEFHSHSHEVNVEKSFDRGQRPRCDSGCRMGHLVLFSHGRDQQCLESLLFLELLDLS